MTVILLIAFCINMIVLGVVVTCLVTAIASFKKTIKKLQVRTSSIYFMNRRLFGDDFNEYVKNRTQQNTF